MSVYMIVEAKEVLDKQKYGEYISKVPQIIEQFGGKYIVRGGKVSAVEGNWNPARLIIVEFESMDKFKQWWNSPEYRKIAPIREQSAKMNAIVVEGV
ncbi:MAG: DUF1330 domain-containing protein [Planctomycetes bacterium HGW-Planctomycetes-1]|nr:MAG: DUF1330 domain-containing protein [Planctomycetes bacterium HGW-Planctomycetes-1]